MWFEAESIDYSEMESQSGIRIQLIGELSLFRIIPMKETYRVVVGCPKNVFEEIVTKLEDT